ncbi:sugar isomerase domain-containing protein [Amphibacillus sp. Q70]|uniref:sugar isomerase domain-containing protein n=1 Tax=Amphibacillus sp. Q70 TaxID=3453416 RepID=UPI003F860548
MFKYFDEICSRLKIVEEAEQENIISATQAITEAILAKQSIFAFGASHAGILTQELFYRAGGLMNINPIFGNEVSPDVEPISRTSEMERLVGYGTILANKTPFANGDLLILHSVSGRNPVTIELAMTAKKKGVKIIGITNLTYSKKVDSRHPDGHNMYYYCDIVIDNHGDVGDAMIEIEGIDQKVAPSSTVIGATILNTIVSEVVKSLVEAGVERPPIFHSANLDDGDQLNKTLLEQYKDTIHYKY